MMLLLNQYKKIRKIDYNLFLVEDIKQGAKYAMRCRPKEKIDQDYQQEYRKREIRCMKDLESSSFVKLIRQAEDEDNYYVIQEYCEENLLDYQAKLPNKVFTLELANRLFEVNPQKRITLSQLKLHSMFLPYFPSISSLSQFNRSPQSCLKVHLVKLSLFQYCLTEITEQKSALFRESDRLMLAYSYLKKVMLMLKAFEEAILDQDMSSICPDSNQLPKPTQRQAEQVLKQINQKMTELKLKLARTYDCCLPYLSQISKINRHFEKAFERSVKSSFNSDFFRLSYKVVCTYAYGKIREAIRNEASDKYLFMIALVLVYDRLLGRPREIEPAFQQFVAIQKMERLDFKRLTEWLKEYLIFEEDYDKIRARITKNLLQLHFT